MNRSLDKTSPIGMADNTVQRHRRSQPTVPGTRKMRCFDAFVIAGDDAARRLACVLGITTNTINTWLSDWRREVVR